MALDIIGIFVLVVLYFVILIIGIWAAKRSKQILGEEEHSDEEPINMAMVANRKLGTFVGICTMTATYICGSYINGTAESVAEYGLVWTLAPPGIFLGMIIGGLFFAKRMRERNYVTLLDPFEEKFGQKMAGILFIAALFADIFWTSSVMAALGTSIAVVINMDTTLSIIISSAVAVLYTVIGQMISVAYTDVIQLAFMAFGLFLSLPFVFTNSNVGSIVANSDEWLGSLPNNEIAVWLDFFVVMIFGSIPWQSYFQRVLSAKSGRQAQVFSIIGSFGALLLAVPPALLGAAGVVANWTETSYGASPVANNESEKMLPLVLDNFTPPAVSLLGLCAIATAVMSSMDSAILGSSSMFTHNIYKILLRPKASGKELLHIQRMSIIVVGVISCTVALTVSTIYGMFIIAADLVFVALLPQLITSVYFIRVNTYGSLLGFLTAVVLRVLAGEPSLQLPTYIFYGDLYDAEKGHLFPYRTFAMLSSLTVILSISYITFWLFNFCKLPLYFDVFRCFSKQLKITQPEQMVVENRAFWASENFHNFKAAGMDQPLG